MKALMCSFLPALLAHAAQAQGAQQELERRIEAFAVQAEATLGDTSAEAHYEAIAAQAADLARELRRYKQEVPCSVGDPAMAYALADYYKADPQLSTYYLTTALQGFTQLIMADEMPRGHGSLVDVHELALQAAKARKPARRQRLHQRLSRQLHDLAALMNAGA